MQEQSFVAADTHFNKCSDLACSKPVGGNHRTLKCPACRANFCTKCNPPNEAGQIVCLICFAPLVLLQRTSPSSTHSLAPPSVNRQYVVRVTSITR